MLSLDEENYHPYKKTCRTNAMAVHKFTRCLSTLYHLIGFSCTFLVNPWNLYIPITHRINFETSELLKTDTPRDEQICP